jgi:hypothetical protein
MSALLDTIAPCQLGSGARTAGEHADPINGLSAPDCPRRALVSWSASSQERSSATGTPSWLGRREPAFGHDREVKPTRLGRSRSSFTGAGGMAPW